MCNEHDPTKLVPIGLADTGAGLVCMCCRLDCLACGVGYTTCDCTEYPRDPRRHPYADSEEDPPYVKLDARQAQRPTHPTSIHGTD